MSDNEVVLIELSCMPDGISGLEVWLNESHQLELCQTNNTDYKMKVEYIFERA